MIITRLDENGRCVGTPRGTDVIIAMACNVLGLFIVPGIAIFSFILPLRKSLTTVYSKNEIDQTTEPVC